MTQSIMENFATRLTMNYNSFLAVITMLVSGWFGLNF